MTGLVLSKEKAALATAAGAEAVIGTLDDLDLLCATSLTADAAVHTAFDHDFSRLPASAEQKRRAIAAIGEAIAGLGQRLIVTSGVAMSHQAGQRRKRTRSGSAGPRKAEVIARSPAGRGVDPSTIRLAPTVHGTGDHGFLTVLIGIARRSGVSAYVGDGLNRWPPVHRQDAARLYRLVLEQEVLHPVYHAIAEEGIPFRKIAEVIGRSLGLPIEPRTADHFGWFGAFAAADIPASSERTRTALGWQPSGPDLLADLVRPGYFTGAQG